jgi:hypothetical protein
MTCIECKALNLEENRFCGKCGTELGRTLDETIRKRGFRDRQATEIEITEAVIARLMKWATYLGSITALLVVLFGLLLGKSYVDLKTTVDTGKTQIESAVTSGKTDIETTITQAKKDIDATRQATSSLRSEVEELKSHFPGYKQVTKEMEELQRQFHGQTTDLSKLNLRVHSLETVPTPEDEKAKRPSSLSLGTLGCGPDALAKGTQVAYCAQGAPHALYLYQRSLDGEVKPVSAVSPIGFQDASTLPKPTCDATRRGTFYVEKGAGNVADEPFLCAKEADGKLGWIALNLSH